MISTPTRNKTRDNMTKHLTKAESDAMEQAEAEILPERVVVELAPPKWLKQDKAASALWNQILERMEDVFILDDLDSEILAVYCAMMSRRDAMDKLCRELMKQVADKKLEADGKLELIGKIDGLLSKLQSHEKTVLQYAEKLGLTPTGRVHLARKRSAQAVSEDPDGYLFGD